MNHNYSVDFFIDNNTIYHEDSLVNLFRVSAKTLRYKWGVRPIQRGGDLFLGAEVLRALYKRMGMEYAIPMGESPETRKEEDIDSGNQVGRVPVRGNRRRKVAGELDRYRIRQAAQGED